MGTFARFIRALTVGRSLGLPLMVSVIVPLAAQAQGNTGTTPTQLEAQIATLKAETAALVVSARLEAPSQQQGLSAPPVIFRVPGALAEFKDCPDCPQMVVIPAGEFTMGAPEARRAAAVAVARLRGRRVRGRRRSKGLRAGSGSGSSAPSHHRNSIRRQQI
jgi:formylglycine-generating enzyme required for sulfatase activity